MTLNGCPFLAEGGPFQREASTTIDSVLNDQAGQITRPRWRGNLSATCVDSYMNTNLRVDYRPEAVSGNWQIFLNVRNLFDRTPPLAPRCFRRFFRIELYELGYVRHDRTPIRSRRTVRF